MLSRSFVARLSAGRYSPSYSSMCRQLALQPREKPAQCPASGNLAGWSCVAASVGGSGGIGAGGGLGLSQQQRRWRWTKAKKKRFERFHRRQEMDRLGKALPKPPYYFPIDTPVANAVPREQRERESRELDLLAAQEFRLRLEQVEKESPVVLRHHMTQNAPAMSDRVRRLLDLKNGSQMEVVRAQKERAMRLFQLRPGDTGSSAVQVVALTNRIQQLTTHFQKHHKDKHGKRGLAALYVRRRKLLDYMERKDFDAYRKVVKTLGLVR